MASPISNSSTESSPSYHPMILRSYCRSCCAAEAESAHLVRGRAARSRKVQKSHLNGNLSYFHHHHHHHHHHENSSSKKNVQHTDDVDSHISGTLDSRSSSSIQQETSTSKNIVLELPNSLHKSSVEQIISSLSHGAVTRNLVSGYSNIYSSNYTSASVHKETFSDYSSGNESGEFYTEAERRLLNKYMSRTRFRTRTPLPSAHFVSDYSDDNEDGMDAVSMFLDKQSGSVRARSSHLTDSDVCDVGSSNILHYSNSGRQVHGMAASRDHHLLSVGGSYSDISLNNESLVEDEALLSSSASGQPSFSHSDSMFTAFRWMFWRCIYLTVCEVLLFDTWLLSRCNTIGKKKIALILLLLLLIPFWFLGSFSAEDYTGDLQNHLHNLKPTEMWNSIFSFGFLSSWFANKHLDSGSLPIYNDNTGATQSMLSNMWHFFSPRNEVSSIKSSGPSGKSDFTSVSNSDTSEEKIKLLALEVFKQQSSQLIEQLEKSNKQNKNDAEQQQNMKIVHSEISSINSQYQALSDSLKTLKAEITEQLKNDVADNLHGQMRFQMLNSKLLDLEQKLQSFETLLASAKNCCGNQSDYLTAESQMTSLLMKVMEGHEDENLPILSIFRSWLLSSFISRNNLTHEIFSVIENKYGNLVELSQEHYEGIAKRVAESVISKSMKSLKHDVISTHKTTSSSVFVEQLAQGTFRIEDIQKIVKEAILLYDADKTGRVDYALESGGGSIISTRCSETYNAGTARLSIFGLPLWYTSKSPRTAIQPEVQPGECWAFHGSQGFLVIQLSAIIKPTEFSMEHIPKSLSPTGAIDSAPKEFSVWGLTSEKNDVGILLGEFMYDSDGDPLQYFPVEHDIENYYSIVELKIHSNWGNQKYTCLYRFRVHGTPL